jgi:hypothetical protein
MSGLEEVEVVIAPDGTVQVLVKGVKGPSCIDLTKEMERYLGGKVAHRRHTHEYDERPVRTDDRQRDEIG